MNNAGMSMWPTVEDVQDVARFKQVMDVNFLGSVYCTKFALPFLKKTQGRIAAISSVASLTGVPSPENMIISSFEFSHSVSQKRSFGK